MREIKFRAWDGKKMHQSPELFEIDNFGRVLGERVRVNEIFGKTEIKDWKLMQYTGLKDKNGKEIWEGDIVKLYSDFDNGWTDNRRVSREVVEWGDAAFVIREVSDYKDRVLTVPSMHELLNQVGGKTEYSFEIIGNVWETPNLLDV